VLHRDLATRRVIWFLAAQRGKSTRAIAREFGVSAMTVSRGIRKEAQLRLGHHPSGTGLFTRLAAANKITDPEYAVDRPDVKDVEPKPVVIMQPVKHNDGLRGGL
jgi:transposase-like protein